MKNLYKPLLILGAAGILPLTSCDTADPEAKNFNFDNSRFSQTQLANLTATARMPLFLIQGDKFTFTPNAATISHDQSYVNEMNRYGQTLEASGLNVVTFQRYQDPALQARFPALQANWVAGENSTQGILTSADTIDQNEIDIFTKFAANNSTGGGVFSNPFTNSNGPLDGNISTALAQGGLDDANISEQKGDLIASELKSLGKEIYNNVDMDQHSHGGPAQFQYPIMRATVRRVFIFITTSTNADIVNNRQIQGTYTIEEQYQHLYTHNHLDSDAFIRMVMQPGSQFSGTLTVERGTFVLDLK